MPLLPLIATLRRALLGLMLTALAGPAAAGVPLGFTDIGLYKGVDRVDGAIVSASPYFFEVCVVETAGIAAAGLNQVIIPSNQPALPLVPRDADFCGRVEFSDRSSLDAAYPSTGETYAIQLTRASDSVLLEFLLNFTAEPPTAFAQILEPRPGDIVFADSDLPVSWSYPPSPDLCFSFSFGSNVVVTPAMGGSPFYLNRHLSCGTGDTVPGSALTVGINQLAVETFDGFATSRPIRLNGVVFNAETLYKDVNGFGFTAAARTMDLTFIDLVKTLDRIDGTIPESPAQPYFIQACLGATGLSGPVFMDTPPPITTTTLQPMQGSVDTYCFQQGFTTLQALEASYPSSASYAFRIRQADGLESTIALELHPLPISWIEFTNPVDGANVPASQNLDVTWIRESSQFCRTDGCGSGIEFLLTDLTTGMVVVEDTGLAILDTSKGVGSAVLIEGHSYELEVKTIVEAQEDLTNGSDLFTVLRLGEDINVISFSVPEPRVALLQATALACLCWLVRRSRGGRRSRSYRSSRSGRLPTSS